jgi:amidase
LKGKKIGVDWAYIAEGVTPEVLALTETAAAVMAELGAEIVPISFPDPSELFMHLLESIQAELAVAICRRFRRRPTVTDLICAE